MKAPAVAHMCLTFHGLFEFQDIIQKRRIPEIEIFPTPSNSFWTFNVIGVPVATVVELKSNLQFIQDELKEPRLN